MRIIIVSTYYPNNCDPVRAIFIKNLSDELSRHSNIDIVSPVPRPPVIARGKNNCLSDIPETLSEGNKNIYYPGFFTIPGLEFINGLMYSLCIYKIIKTIKNKNKNEKIIIHSHCIYPDGFGSSIVARILKLPCVLTSHGSDINVLPARKLLKPQIRYAIKHADGVIGVSKSLVRKINDLVSDYKIKSEYIPCAGFFPDKFNVKIPRVDQKDKCVEIIFIGNLVKIKALDVLLEAWQKVINSAGDSVYHLTIIGEGPEKDDLVKLSVSLGITESVKFLGRVEYTNINQHIINSDFLCLPSYNEGTPNVVIEALACGKPVIGSNVGAIPELLENNNGIVVTAGDPDNLATAMLEAPGRSWDRNTISSSVKEFSWSIIGARNNEYLKQICDSYYD